MWSVGLMLQTFHRHRVVSPSVSVLRGRTVRRENARGSCSPGSEAQHRTLLPVRCQMTVRGSVHPLASEPPSPPPHTTWRRPGPTCLLPFPGLSLHHFLSANSVRSVCYFPLLFLPPLSLTGRPAACRGRGFAGDGGGGGGPEAGLRYPLIHQGLQIPASSPPMGPRTCCLLVAGKDDCVHIVPDGC
ncbi:hypothetical protein Cadr_000014676 [Camelus dromedarius]|uniref:Uncharacterized protein n=1 Tax=Camelus dromedarius TaxID=9838 RepID=A0A5N4DNR6_CAMDR|nr:hypothetical protein Cadr_000014676 [Camelus dromedarius]